MNRLRGLTRARLCSDLGIADKQLNDLAASAPDRYRERSLDAGEKTRQLLVPDGGLMHFQRQFYNEYLRDFPFPEAVFCCKGKGAVGAARKHRKHCHLLHLDIAGFFPSVTVGSVRAAFAGSGVSPELVNTLTRLVTVRGELPQGAPTSVAVGNLVLHRLDRRVQGLCDASGAGFTYTRYIDDIALSGGSRLENFVPSVRNIVEDCGWELNEKGGMLGPSEHHHLLGLCVGVDVTVDEQYLSDLRLALEKVQEEGPQRQAHYTSRLRGRIAWVKGVQPEVGRELKEVLDQIIGA
jgi:hypothetical protein